MSGSNGAPSPCQAQREVQRRGACRALTSVCERFGASLPARLLELSLSALDAGPPPEDAVQPLINALQVTEVITPALHADIRHLVRTAASCVGDIWGY